ncbi:alpha-ketoglutarate-dependent dioxygenase AlkB [Sphingomonas sp. S2-65]|uniref:alpha-ketoglutarate-dependent dioxygenase AlkB n=1 Tax=Sphingomonas sp. S2-65 TaxID=2903960 RepID=UPI001F20E42F|nr:alpha-ketoglutarate-dependent dioxygenase AlkB [Sphingomonas sp. S2-65]UYY59723.1 alpha-ketoglutarate-dependent dioxygenase AlkB [Sphingomonas sp. S2-65]
MNKSPSNLELFAKPLPPGCAYRAGILSEAEEQALIESLRRTDLTPFRFQGWLGKRLTASFGWRYDFDSGSFEEAEPLPDWLLPLRERAAAVAGLKPEALAQALLIRYDPGAGIGWHKDRPVFEDVLGISLGTEATLRLRRRLEKGFERHSVPLAPRSIYHLSGAARYVWEHSIAPIDAARWSITFRSLASPLPPQR